eukprot:scaffold2740_cov122-Skeletonema_marinoi.AAC.2
MSNVIKSSLHFCKQLIRYTIDDNQTETTIKSACVDDITAINSTNKLLSIPTSLYLLPEQ